jgi:hypothetical protein
MKTMLLIAGAAAVSLTAGVSQAATHHRHAAAASAGAYAQPSQPIAYTQLSAYLKASPRQRARGDWAGQMAAATGSTVNAAAATPAAPAAPDTAMPSAATPTPTTPDAAPANPPPAAAAPAAQPAQPPQ